MKPNSGSGNQLLNGYIFNNNQVNSNSLTATISGIPYTNYALYAYFVDANVGNTEKLTIGGKTFYYSMTNSAIYIQVTNTSSTIYPTGNYVVASGLTGIRKP